MQTPMPKTIGSYTFISAFQKPSSSSTPYIYGIYEDAHHHRALAKGYIGNPKDLPYLRLAYEITVISILRHALERLKTHIPPNITRVHIPTLLKVETTPHTLFMLEQYIDGDSLIDKSPAVKFNSFIKAVDFLQYIGTHLTASEKSTITQRSGRDLILGQYLLGAKAAMIRKDLIMTIIKALLSNTTTISSMLSLKARALAHRDLHYKNIVLVGSHIYILDFAFCAFTVPAYDYINTLGNVWNDRDFRRLLITYINNKFSDHKNWKHIFSHLAIRSSIHALSGTGYGREKEANYRQFLSYGINALRHPERS